MSGPMLVNATTISQAAGDVKNTANNIKAQLDDLEAGVKRIAQSWQGNAQTAYQGKQTEWDQRAASLHATLESIASALQAASEHYSATEARNTGVWHH